MADGFEALAGADPRAAARVLDQVRKRVFVPHVHQAPVIASPARFRIVRAGRRFGKTKVSAREIILAAISKPDSMNWWVANTYRNVRRGYREVLRQLPPELLAKPAPPSTSNELILSLKTGAQIEFYSGGNPDALAGEGVDFVVVDEGALIPDNVWSQLIRPTLMDSKGRALIISTPRGHNWFWKVWQMGQDPLKPQYASWHFTSYDNPHIAGEEIDELKESLPEIIFRQEVLAEFLSGAGAVFNLEKAITVAGLAAPAGQLFLGVDLAKHQDFTVLQAEREDGLPVYHDRFNSLSWPVQRRKIRSAIRELEGTRGVSGVTVLVDSTGLGDVIFDDLDEDGFDVVPINFKRSKPEMVKQLGADIERRRAAVLESTVHEFEAYEYSITPAGNMTYQAPEGGHDDEVSAKMLAHWGRVHEAPGDIHVESASAEEAEEEVEQMDLGEFVPSGEPDSAAEIMARADAWT